MHARVVLGVGKGVLFREVSSVIPSFPKQMEGEGKPPCSPYNPLLPLLSSSMLHLSLCLAYSEAPPTVWGGASETTPLSVCEEGLVILGRSVLPHDCLKSSLLSHRGQSLSHTHSTKIVYTRKWIGR